VTFYNNTDAGGPRHDPAITFLNGLRLIGGKALPGYDMIATLRPRLIRASQKLLEFGVIVCVLPTIGGSDDHVIAGHAVRTESLNTFVREVLRRVRTIPGVDLASMTINLLNKENPCPNEFPCSRL